MSKNRAKRYEDLNASEREDLSTLELKELQRYREVKAKRSGNPLEVIGGDPNYVYRWLADRVLHEKIPGAIERAMMAFWKPVASEELPEMVDPSQESSVIKREDLILHKRKKIFDEDDKKDKLAAENRVLQALRFPPGFGPFGYAEGTNIGREPLERF